MNNIAINKYGYCVSIKIVPVDNDFLSCYF